MLSSNGNRVTTDCRIAIDVERKVLDARLDNRATPIISHQIFADRRQLDIVIATQLTELLLYHDVNFLFSPRTVREYPRGAACAIVYTETSLSE